MDKRIVEVVVVNFKRPQNIGPILAAFRSQTVPCLITLIDTHQESQFELPESVLSLADRIFSWKNNYGGWNRFVPLGEFHHEYTYFHDDDMLPGHRVIEYFLQYAEKLGDFGVLGHVGRNIAAASSEYTLLHPVNQADDIQETDIVIRGYFVRSKHLLLMQETRRRFQYQKRGCDVVLSVAMSLNGLRNYVLPVPPDPEMLMVKAELPDDYALWRESGHLEERSSLVAQARSMGWRSLDERRGHSAQRTNVSQNGLDETIKTLLHRNRGRQMSEAEYRYIASQLGGKNFLVFGTGHDSDLWRQANSGGLTLFLEHDPTWLKKGASDVLAIAYTCKIQDWMHLLNRCHHGDASGLELALPPEVTQVSWDLILVDSPSGFDMQCPGRMQSIYAAKKLSQRFTRVFIHDSDRVVERTYGNYFFRAMQKFDKLVEFACQ